MTTHAQSPVRLASVGVGQWGVVLADGVVASKAAQIVTCYARSEAHRREFAARYGCRVAPSYEALLEDPEVEGILLTTPNSPHRAQIEAAARHGKHVLVEKPITLTVADGLAATQACKEAGVVLAVGHQQRREPGIRRLKGLIEESTLGQVVAVEANISTDTGMKVTPDAWRWTRAECPGGSLIQIGIHLVDTLSYLLGPIVRVFGVQRHVVIPAEIEDVTATLLEFESGVIGHLTSCYCTARVMDLRVMGTLANARYDRMLGLEIIRDTQNQAVRTIVPVPAGDPIVEEIAEFAHCIRHGGRPEVGGEEATYAVAVVLAAIASQRRGAPVEVAQIMTSQMDGA